MARLKLSTKF